MGVLKHPAADRAATPWAGRTLGLTTTSGRLAKRCKAIGGVVVSLGETLYRARAKRISRAATSQAIRSMTGPQLRISKPGALS